MVQAATPDLVVLDLNLPKRDGIDVLRALRAGNNGVPVMVLTSRADLDTRIACLEMGADDFVAKPFSTRELRARCKALLRRTGHAPATLRCGVLELSRADRTVTLEGQPVSLTNKEFALLECLMAHRGSCVSRSVLLERVWQTPGDGNTGVIDVYVNYLRRKLKDGSGGSLIRTVRGLGYYVTAGDMLPPLPLPNLQPNAVADSTNGSAAEIALLNVAPSWRMYGNGIGEQSYGNSIAGQL